MVVDYLFAKGYAIVGQNVRLGALEIDVVARRGDVVAVVEVRTRGKGSFDPALATVTKAKQARLLRAARRLWEETYARAPDVERVRIDVAAVYLDEGAPRVEYFEGAITGE